MKDEVKKISELRDSIAVLKESIKTKKEAHAKELEVDAAAVKVLEVKLVEAIKVLTPLALAEYVKTGVKKLYAGVSIKVNKTITYDKLKALDWAIDKKLCLDLNVKSFEALAKTQALDFVKLGTVDTVTLPKIFKLED